MLAVGLEGKKKVRQALRFWRGSFPGGSISWGAVGGSLACSRKFILADRCHEAKKRNQAMLGFCFALLTVYIIC